MENETLIESQLHVLIQKIDLIINKTFYGLIMFIEKADFKDRLFPFLELVKKREQTVRQSRTFEWVNTREVVPGVLRITPGVLKLLSDTIESKYGGVCSIQSSRSEHEQC